MHFWRYEHSSVQRGLEELGSSCWHRPLRVTILDARDATWVKPWLNSHTWRMACKSGPTSSTGRNMAKSSAGRKEADDLKEGKKPTEGSYFELIWLGELFSVAKHAPWGDNVISSSGRITVVLLARKPSRTSVTSWVSTDKTGGWIAKMLLRHTHAPKKRCRNKMNPDQTQPFTARGSVAEHITETCISDKFIYITDVYMEKSPSQCKNTENYYHCP